MKKTQVVNFWLPHMSTCTHSLSHVKRRRSKTLFKSQLAKRIHNTCMSTVPGVFLGNRFLVIEYCVLVL